MTWIKHFVLYLIALGLCLCFTEEIRAQSNQTYVASYGNDTYSCTRASPCRSFATALTKTAAGGEIIAIDSAEYEPFTINKAVAITAGSGYVGIRRTTSGPAIAVAAGANDSVVLRGLTLLGLGSATNGIHFISGASLHVENCVINGFKNFSGIRFEAAGALLVKDTAIKNCNTGIRIKVYNTKVTIDHCRIEKNGYGMQAENLSQVTVRDSVIANNTEGISAQGGSTVAVENCLLTGHTTAIHPVCVSCNPGVGSKVYVSNSTLTFNSTALSASSPNSIVSFGNNRFIKNTTDGAFTSTLTQK
jgi:hypothetical protein